MSEHTQGRFMEDHIADVNGVTLHYRTIDQGEVLFLVSPGWGVGSDLQRAFPSMQLKGGMPLSPNLVLNKSIRPALVRAGIVSKNIGWHSFRHSLATGLPGLLCASK